MDNTKLPDFPVLDLTDFWIESDGIISDKFCYVNSQKDFEQLLLNNEVVDVNDDVYRIAGRTKLPAWRRLVPFMCRYELIFQPLNEKMELQDIKNIMLSRLQDFEEDHELKIFINNASTTKQLIEGW